MNKLIPSLWFEADVNEVFRFYQKVFDDIHLIADITLHEGTVYETKVLYFTLRNTHFMAMGNGPFKMHPSMSFFYEFNPVVDSKAEEKMMKAYEALKDGGWVITEPKETGYAKLYAFVIDKYGLSWRLCVRAADDTYKTITPTLLYSGKSYGKAIQAINLYKEILKDVEIVSVYKNDKDMVDYGEFIIFGQRFIAIDFPTPNETSEALSLQVLCKDQDEMDQYFDGLTADPDAEACGWLKDPYGFSWQINLEFLHNLTLTGSKEDISKVFEVIFPMKKLNLQAIKDALKS